MLLVNCGSHADYHNFVATKLRKYYPNLDALARSTWDIIERFWNLDIMQYLYTSTLKSKHQDYPIYYKSYRNSILLNIHSIFFL